MKQSQEFPGLRRRPGGFGRCHGRRDVGGSRRLARADRMGSALPHTAWTLTRRAD